MLLDAHGNPVPPSGETPMFIDKVVDEIDQEPANWDRMLDNFSKMCGSLAVRAEEIHGLVDGTRLLDLTNKNGQALLRALAHVTMCCIMFERKQRKANEEETGNGTAAPASPVADAGLDRQAGGSGDGADPAGEARGSGGAAVQGDADAVGDGKAG